MAKGLQGRRPERTYRLRIPIEGPYLPRAPRIGGHVRATLYLMLVLLLAVSGCATTSGEGPELGIRAGYEALNVQRVAVLHVVPESSWGLDDAQLLALLATYETRSTAGLEGLGLEVVDHDAVAQALKGTPFQDRLGEALDIDRSLGELFEDGGDVPSADERLSTVTAIGEHLGVQAVFLARVVYHTEALCDGTNDSEYTPYVILPDGEPEDDRVPCVVSHFEAKLVDARTGKTIWYNRALREVRARSSDSAHPNATTNAEATVDLVLHEGPTSLQVLVRR